jgi:glycosyltransferase involved in cell wall biosynthesis
MTSKPAVSLVTNEITTTTTTTTTTRIEVDVIIPVHNASLTILESVKSALHQELPTTSLLCDKKKYSLSVTVCCYDDGSTDNSLDILKMLLQEHKSITPSTSSTSAVIIPSQLLLDSSSDGVARGAGFARNRAVEINNSIDVPKKNILKFLCFLDSDDIMHKHRVAAQTTCMLSLDEEARKNTLLGCTFGRDPPDSTWHYSQWANSLSDERLLLERYREITILQPTWFMPLSVWSQVGGYIEAPPSNGKETVLDLITKRTKSYPCLIHSKYDTCETLKLAEDLRFFHAHLQLNGNIKLLRTETPMVTYRHTADSNSQSFRTSRQLLLQLRVLAFEQSVLCKDPKWEKFIIWGAGRDGKAFFKALNPDFQSRVYCFVDVDAKKLNSGYYFYREGDHKDFKIPIVHFSFLIPDKSVRRNIQSEWGKDGAAKDALDGRIDKSKATSNIGGNSSSPSKKKQKVQARSAGFHFSDCGLNEELLISTPVVVCVAMYRTNGVLEKNVACIRRTEGKDLWHFS